MPEEEVKEATATPEPSAPKGGKIFTILLLVNTIVVVGALGVMVYTRMLFERPKITEGAERQRLLQTKNSEQKKPTILIDFPKFTVNIKSNPAVPRSTPGTEQQIGGKFHYVTIAFQVELRDPARAEIFESLRPIFMDKLLGILGRKAYHQLTHVQGRYVLRSQILQLANKLMGEPVAINVFFTKFLVQ